MYSYNGIGEMAITLKNNGVNPGCVVKIGASDTAYWCSSGAAFHGVCLWGKDENVTVQVGGFVTVSYTGSTVPTTGFCELVSDGSGGVKVLTGVNGNVPRLVVAVDTTESLVTFLL